MALTKKEQAILAFLAANKGKPADCRRIYEQVWGDPFLPSARNTVAVHILRLRKKTGKEPACPYRIRTLWGKGYFLAEQDGGEPFFKKH